MVNPNATLFSVTGRGLDCSPYKKGKARAGWLVSESHVQPVHLLLSFGLGDSAFKGSFGKGSTLHGYEHICSSPVMAFWFLCHLNINKLSDD